LRVEGAGQAQRGDLRFADSQGDIAIAAEFGEYTVEAGGPAQLLVPVTTPDEGRLEGLALRSVALVYAGDGSETILNGEWAVSFTYDD